MQESKLYARLFDQQQSLYECYARQNGLQSKGMLMLMWLYYNPQGITQNKIVQATYSTKQVVHASIKKWQAKGYVSLVDNQEDKRHKLVQLTSQGKAYAQRILAPLEAIEDQALAVFNAEEKETFLALSQVYTKALSQAFKEGKKGMMTLHQVTKTYEDKEALKGIDLTIQKGEFFVLVGKSGSGKTTLLKMLNRLIEPDSGEIEREGKALAAYDLRDLRLDTGYVLQSGVLFPNLSVFENISLIPEMKGWSREERLSEARRLMREVDLDPDVFLNRMPSELSGGQAQRVGILRAIISKPQVLLMDEPFSALDPLSKGQLQELMKRLHQQYRMTIVFVTHDMGEALKLADRIGVMADGQLIQVDRPEQMLNHPKDDRVKALFKGEVA